MPNKIRVDIVRFHLYGILEQATLIYGDGKQSPGAGTGKGQKEKPI